VHSIVAAIELLTEVKLDPAEIIAEINTSGGGGVSFALRQIRHHTSTAGSSAAIPCKKTHSAAFSEIIAPQPQVLRATAEAENIASLVTIYWWFRQSPRSITGINQKITIAKRVQVGIPCSLPLTIPIITAASFARPGASSIPGSMLEPVCFGWKTGSSEEPGGTHPSLGEKCDCNHLS
jgi:hypothetical protein